jgi:predicted MPP superfamily phosphohydrolase
MKKNIALAGLFILLNLCVHAQKDSISKRNDTISQRIVLIGDAGQLTDGKHPVVDAVRSLIPLDKKTTILFLGDNIYPNGLPVNEYTTFGKYRDVLDSQLTIAKGTPAKVYMIPGNHDWKNGGRDGYESILREGLYVDFLVDSLAKQVQFWPKEGCPGPHEVDLGNDVVLILFDSQWWLHPYDKPDIESDCDCKTKDELVEKIADIAGRNVKKLVILASHHPFRSNSVHGGYFKLKQHLFPFTDIFPSAYIPLPVIGSIYPLARSVFGTPQDLHHPVYADMISRISGAIKLAAPNIIFAAGHEHNLELIQDSSYQYIISGGGSKNQRVSTNKRSAFISPTQGFSVIEVSTNKNVSVTFYTVTDSIRKVYTSYLLNFSKIPDKFLDSSSFRGDDPFLKYKDTVTVPASKNFKVVNGLRETFLGQNYRKEWLAPVNMKVFNIKKEKGGFTIDPEGLGGGKQTKSLTLKDSKGRKWVLRTVDKNDNPAVPREYRSALPDRMMRDLNSAAHPYAALTIPSLAKPLDIPVAHPELFFVPDDPAFGFFRKLFAGKVCMLEEKDPSPGGKDTKSTATVFSDMLHENDHRPNEPAVLKARLLDILIGDFERHFDQWKWIKTDTGKGKVYDPIPKDRDQAFFYSDGLQMKLVSGRVMPFLKGFRHDIPSINWLGYTAKDFDRIFLSDLDAGEWKRAITDVQEKITDSVIRNAVHKLPPEVFPFNGEKIIQKLISRRDLLSKRAMDYYNFISKKVNVIGSNKKEYFRVSNDGDGLRVRVYARERGNDTSFKMYDRVFNPSITKEIRLLGLNDNDLFEIDSTASSRIKFRIIGGQGEDTFDIKGNVENLLYDLSRKGNGNFIKNGHHSKNRFSLDPPVNENTITGFDYNTSKFPELVFSYNSDDGALTGLGFSKTTHGFRNLPYATNQKFAALYSMRGAYQLYYRGEFNHITRNTDLLIQANFLDPALRNFFGYGNKTKVDPTKNYDFYRNRYHSFEAEALLRKRYFEKFHIMVGPYYYQYSNSFKENTGNVMTKPRLVGLDSADIFSSKAYLGGKFAIHMDNRNNELFPTRGVHWDNEFTYVAGMKKGSDNFSSITTDMSLYVSQGDPPKIIAVVGLGYGHIFSKHYEFFQAMDIGANDNLHGFRKNRYAGNSSAYLSLEGRIKLFNVNSYILPGPLGLTVFSDLGRVWLKGESSSRWHTAFGGGLYFIPFNQFVISASAGISGKDKLLSFNVGTKIGLTF